VCEKIGRTKSSVHYNNRRKEERRRGEEKGGRGRGTIGGGGGGYCDMMIMSVGMMIGIVKGKKKTK